MPPRHLAGGLFITCPFGKRQDTLERFYLSAGLGMLWESAREAGGRGWGEEHLGFLAEAVPPATRMWIREIDLARNCWVNEYIEYMLR